MGRQGRAEVPREELRHDHEEDRASPGDGHVDGAETGGGNGPRSRGE